MIDTRSLDGFAEELQIQWTNLKLRIRAAHANHSPVECGQILYADCLSHTCKLDNLEPPAHFVRGSWHALADDLRIGWHPEYLALMNAGAGALMQV